MSVLVVGVAGLLVRDVPEEYFSAPEAAGDLVRDVPPAEGQTIAWRTSGIATPRWLSWYWDLPTAEIGVGSIEQVPAQDLVLVRLDRAPEWLGDRAAVAEAALERRGGYVLTTAASLREIAASSDGPGG